MNRLVGVDFLIPSDPNRICDKEIWDNGLNRDGSYSEEFNYDGNGNIDNAYRNGDHGSSIDQLHYNYINGTNKLEWVKDDVGKIGNDLDNQQSGNYSYDATGNLVSDVSEHLERIHWNVYGKISSIEKSHATDKITDIFYTYDPSGHRISSEIVDETGLHRHTWYVRDAQGNVMAVYSYNSRERTLFLSEQHLYGCSRLGILHRDYKMGTQPQQVSVGILGYAQKGSFERGARQYELTNHLGNVQATLSDVKIPHDQNGDGIIDWYEAMVLTANDYYSFGMGMEKRQFVLRGGMAYRLGLMEKRMIMK